MKLIKPSTILNVILGLSLIAVVAAAAKPMLTPIPHDEKDIFCLTRNAYYEAKGDSQMSQIAVTHVVLNRLHNGKYPGEVCDVVYQKNKFENKHVVCQFSWYCDKTLMGRRVDEQRWEESLAAVQKALKIYYQRGVDVTEGATYYHANYVNPGWRHLQKVTSIGSHIYYKESENGTTRRSTHEKIVLGAR